MKKILLVTPPLLQLNAPYAATPVLAHFLKRQGVEVCQRDFSLETALKVFTPETVRAAAAAARPTDDKMEFFIESAEDYARTVPEVIAFLQGKRPELAWRIAARTLLPEGPYFSALSSDEDGDGTEMLQTAFGSLGTLDKAKYLASLYLDDLSSFIAASLDPDFSLGRYAEHLAVALPSFEPLKKRLEAPDTYIDRIIVELTQRTLCDLHPDIVGITVPFPGTLYGALKIADTVKKTAPQTLVALGGGYVNSELRSMEDKRIYEYVDCMNFDDGRNELLQMCGAAPVSSLSPVLAPDYDGLNLENYISIVEMMNPLHRIWSDGVWMKMQLAQGCYWHKCAFCDLALSYIGNYVPGTAGEIVDEMERLMKETGRRGFHFVDEALPPALIEGICREILARGLSPVWWGNIRFDKSFTAELAQLMADAGCIAVTGGLECANDRLLKLMNKGITLASAYGVFQAFADAGILVHAYLMYAFPTETAEEAWGALDFVRRCFREGILHSAFWHRFALTAHSAIAKTPEKFGITILEPSAQGNRFALNELQYIEKGAPDWDKIGSALSTALYNYMLGLGLDKKPKFWLKGR